MEAPCSGLSPSEGSWPANQCRLIPPRIKPIPELRRATPTPGIPKVKIPATVKAAPAIFVAVALPSKLSPSGTNFIHI